MRELHGSEAANAYRSLAAAATYQYRYIHVTLPTPYARVPVRQTCGRQLIYPYILGQGKDLQVAENDML